MLGVELVELFGMERSRRLADRRVGPLRGVAAGRRRALRRPQLVGALLVVGDPAVDVLDLFGSRLGRPAQVQCLIKR
jgi:hypothetical protein